VETVEIYYDNQNVQHILRINNHYNTSAEKIRLFIQDLKIYMLGNKGVGGIHDP
jgi:hypothetical protein